MDDERKGNATYKCSRAIEDALTYGKAILKFISPNDVGLTGSHQVGYYLPKKDGVWQLFTSHPPVRGQNKETSVSVLWDDGNITDSRVKWYGAAKAEYRMTRFGKGFPYLTHDCVGDLLVLIPISHSEFRCYVLDIEADIAEIQATLGVQIINSWGVYIEDAPEEKTEDECIDGHFRDFVKDLTAFPSGEAFSKATQEALLECLKKLHMFSPDQKLLRFVEAEYQLFRTAERLLCQSEILRAFKDVEDFLKTAKTITQRRVARAGRSLENHVEYILKESGIPHKMRPKIDGEPDVIIPSEAAYNDPTYPLDKLFVVGIKTTCKDRWRQVLDEGHRKPDKHLITLQQGISGAQLQKMDDAKLTLVVPDKLHSLYPDKGKGHSATILKVDAFLKTVKTALQ